MFKSCKMFQLYVIVTSLLLALILTTTVTHENGFDYDYKDEYKDSVISKSLPQKNDLLTYLKSLRRIIYFCSKHKVDLDMNFEFGLFLTNVIRFAMEGSRNLTSNSSYVLLINFVAGPMTVYLSPGTNLTFTGWVFIGGQAVDPGYTGVAAVGTRVNLKKALLIKGNRIPKHVETYITLLLKENDDLIDFFDYMVNRNHVSREKSNKLITTLFSNESQWIKRLRRFDSVVSTESDVTSQRYSGKSLSWYWYMKSVDDTDQWTPSPKLSDLCMLSLASNEIQNTIQTRCDVYEPCYDMLENGTDFGYALSHRLLFLLHARHSRGCSIFSKEQDESLTKKFCKIIYSEAEFIANNDYQAVDLLLEQMCLCALDGHPQLLKRSWLSNVLRFQTKYGCFGQKLTQAAARPRLSRPPRSWKIAKQLDHRIMDGLCDGHVTSVASATLAAAVRYILETYY